MRTGEKKDTAKLRIMILIPPKESCCITGKDTALLSRQLFQIQISHFPNKGFFLVGYWLWVLIRVERTEGLVTKKILVWNHGNSWLYKLYWYVLLYTSPNFLHGPSLGYCSILMEEESLRDSSLDFAGSKCLLLEHLSFWNNSILFHLVT